LFPFNNISTFTPVTTKRLKHYKNTIKNKILRPTKRGGKKKWRQEHETKQKKKGKKSQSEGEFFFIFNFKKMKIFFMYQQGLEFARIFLVSFRLWL